MNYGLMKLPRNRVRRNYLGGAGIDHLHGESVCRDNDQPEEWVGSMVEAVNPGMEPVDKEGLTKVETEDGEFFLRDLVDGSRKYYLGDSIHKDGTWQLSFLLKILDSAMRLHVQVHPTTSGAEADENAVKVAKAYTTGLGPLAAGVFRARFPYYYRNPEGMPQEKALDYYMQSIEHVFEECGAPDTVAAIVVEPLQGEGGFIPAPLEWVKAVRKVCDKYGILLIADEVQSGFCRTGRMFASEYWKEAGVMPDILATAKSIAAGIPLSAVVAGEEVMESVARGTIGGTFCGNPLACAAALKTIEIMEREHLAERSCQIGEKSRRGTGK